MRLRATALNIVLLALLYALLGKLAFQFALSYKTVTSAVFLSEGVALGFVLLYGARVAPGVFLGQLGLALTTELSLASSLCISAGNTIEALLGLAILRWVSFDSRIPTLRDYLLLVSAIALVLQPFSATLGILTLWRFEALPPGEMGSAFRYWWLGNTQGQLLLTPVILATAAALAHSTWKNILKGPAVAALLFGSAYAVLFATLESFLLVRTLNAFFLVFPAVIAIAAQFGFLGAVLSSLVIAMIAQIFTVQGYGIFVVEDISEQLLYLNSFIVGIALSAGLVGILFHQRRAAERRLRNALDEIKTLRGILPICASCHQIRDDHGEWHRMEHYITQRSDAQFSHGLCEACVERLYGHTD